VTGPEVLRPQKQRATVGEPLRVRGHRDPQEVEQADRGTSQASATAVPLVPNDNSFNMRSGEQGSMAGGETHM
jgi:hypothetical protein